MTTNTKIEWTQHTWNPWQGCQKVSQGCKNCYMYRDKERYGQDPRTVKRSAPTTFNAPLKWPKDKARVFTCSWSDWFIPEADDWRDEAWAIIKATPHLTYQILTKRPERIAGHLPADWGEGYPNVWLGTSVENQEAADQRIPLLLKAPARTRFLSCEPLLGPLDLTGQTLETVWIDPAYADEDPALWDTVRADGGWGIDWIITGGESGAKNKIRPSELDWFRSIRDLCTAAGVAYFHKQHGGSTKINGVWGGRELDGRTWDEFPDEKQKVFPPAS